MTKLRENSILVLNDTPIHIQKTTYVAIMGILINLLKLFTGMIMGLSKPAIIKV